MNPHSFPAEIFKYCPRCGSGTFSPATIKSLICLECGFEYYINVASAVAGLIFNEANELLLTYRANEPAKGKLDLPGGFVDAGEDASEALKREIKEELNLEVIRSEYVGSFPNEYDFGGITYCTLDLVFRCEVHNFKDIRANDDVCDYCFFELSEIPLPEVGLQSIRNIIGVLQKAGS